MRHLLKISGNMLRFFFCHKFPHLARTFGLCSSQSVCLAFPASLTSVGTELSLQVRVMLILFQCFFFFEKNGDRLFLNTILSLDLQVLPSLSLWFSSFAWILGWLHPFLSVLLSSNKWITETINFSASIYPWTLVHLSNSFQPKSSKSVTYPTPLPSASSLILLTSFEFPTLLDSPSRKSSQPSKT